MKASVYCIAKTVTQAENIVTELRTAGFLGDDISVLLPDKGTTKDFAHEKSTKAPEGATAGGTHDDAEARYRSNQSRHWRHVAIGNRSTCP